MKDPHQISKFQPRGFFCFVYLLGHSKSGADGFLFRAQVRALNWLKPSFIILALRRVAPQGYLSCQAFLACRPAKARITPRAMPNAAANNT